METRSLNFTLVVGLLLAIGAVAWWLGPAGAGIADHSGANAAPKPRVQRAREVSVSEPKPAAGALATSDESVRAGVANMRKAFDSAENYRVFIHEAMAHPQQGGRYYADLAYRTCFQTNRLSLPEAAGIRSEAQRQALVQLNRWRDRCAGVDEQVGDLTSFVKRVMAKDGPAGQDVLVRARSVYSQAQKQPAGPATPAVVMAQLSEAMARFNEVSRLGDPWLVSEALMSDTPMLLVAMAPEVTQYLKPAWADDLLPLMASSIACELTETCVRGRVTVMRCAVEGACVDDERDYILSTVPAEQRDAFKAARAALMTKIRARP